MLWYTINTLLRSLLTTQADAVMCATAFSRLNALSFVLIQFKIRALSFSSCSLNGQ